MLKTKISLCCLLVAECLQAQTPTISAVVNGASHSAIISPGALASIFGSGFGNAPEETSVTVGGLSAPVLWISSTQINVQLPFNLPAGDATVTVNTRGQAAEAIGVTVSQYAPAVLVDDRKSVGIFEGADGLITPANPAVPGDTIVAHVVGLGATAPETEAGKPTPLNAAPRCLTFPKVTVGGIPADVLFAGPSRDLPGIYQVKFVVPRVDTGRQDVLISIGGMISPPVKLPVGARRAPGVLAVTNRTVPQPGALLENVAPGTARDFFPLVSQPVSDTYPSGTIAYTCDATINAIAGVCNTLNTTIAALYSAAFSNANASIYITFGSTDLGESYTGLNLVSYSSYRGALIASESSANDATAITDSVPATSPFGSDSVAITTATARALGYSTSPAITGNDGSCCYDGMITISSAMQSSGDLYYRTGTITSGQYDFYTVVQHETDEVLGTASCVFGCDFSGTIAFAPADLLRYHSNGTRSFAAGNNSSCASSNSANACFSIDGVHMLQQYNNLDNGEDGGDWAPNCTHPLVQDSESCPGVAGLNISPTAEILVLDVVGFTLPTCSYSLSSNSASVGPGSGSGTVSVTVTAGSGCTWTASSNAGWLTINSGSPGNGNGTVGYSFTANAGTSTLVGTLTIAGQTFTVSQSPTSSPLQFYTLAPCRVADTRSSESFSGAFGPPSLAGGVARNFPIQSSSCDVPATAQAYSFNITVLPHTTLGYLTAWPTGESFPTVSTLNSMNGQVVANAAIVPAGTSGAISIFASDETDLLIDINGYFAAPGSPQALAFYPMTPCRVADTRSFGGFSGAFGPPSMTTGEAREFPVTSSSCNIPGSAQAYSLNMTVSPITTLGYLTTWPTGGAFPNVSTLNDLGGGLLANAAIVPAGTSGDIEVYVSNATDVIIDIDGYFAPPGSAGALNFYTLTPCRVADTRSYGNKAGAFGPPTMSGGTTRDFPMFSSACGVPETAQAYSLNMTAWPPGPMEFLTTWPVGQTFPTVSTLNAPSGQVVANAAIVPAGTSGAIDVYVSNTTDIFFDINGYFAP